MQSQSNKPKKVSECKEKKSKLDKYLCFAIYSHGNHVKILVFHSYECEGIQTKNSFDEMFNLSFDLGPLKVNNNVPNKSQFSKKLSKGLIIKHT